MSTSEEYQREAYARSLDTIMVHNPTSEDFVMWHDQYGPQKRKVMVPKAQKDIGFGKGNAQLPRHLAARYSEAMVTHLIHQELDPEWMKERKKYQSREERYNAALAAPRSNRPDLWEKYAPKVWLGIVEKYGGEEIPEPENPAAQLVGDPMKDAMSKLNLGEREYVREDSKSTE